MEFSHCTHVSVHVYTSARTSVHVHVCPGTHRAHSRAELYVRCQLLILWLRKLRPVVKLNCFIMLRLYVLLMSTESLCLCMFCYMLFICCCYMLYMIDCYMLDCYIFVFNMCLLLYVCFKFNLKRWAQSLGDLNFQRAFRGENKRWLGFETLNLKCRKSKVLELRNLINRNRC